MENKYSYFKRHSEECENLFRTFELNYIEVKKEIDNYNEFRENSKNHLRRLILQIFQI